MFSVVFGIALSGYAMGDVAHVQESQLLNNLKIVPSPSMVEILKDMKSVFSYVTGDEKFDGEGIKIKHEGRTFIAQSAEDVEKAMDVLKKYPAPTEGAINAMKSEEVGSKSRQGNFIVYFLDSSGYKENLQSNKEGFEGFVSTDLSLASSLGIPVPGIYGYNSSDKLSYKLELSDENNKRILSLSNLPIFGFTSSANISLYRALSGTIFYIFFDMKNGPEVLAEYSGTLNDFRYDIRVILIPSIKGSIDLGEYGLTEESLPGCMSISEDGGKYILKNVSRENISGFIKDVLDKKAEIFYKSQDEPEDNASRNVKVVTRNNIKTYLEDTSKDRFIVFGTERCPHCIRIKPIIERLGEIVKENANDKVLVGYCDVGMNDMNDFDIQFVPTLLLYKSGGRESVRYSGGERNLLNLVRFIREFGGLGIDLSMFVTPEGEERKFEVGDEADAVKEEDVRAEL
ncbi:protein disulfide isomerase [Encephalitozoon romaleae SJ-2008]|uniref:Protein disulfide isomerase n=1 Tax=Encephalitozoon romaleae (strain SJ-2008) TaxID=1178016 RepID=I6ZVK4_ENCRO|nr:protein disulfide isomerase [Encephalitozoon romaleae SJ-2008]AFN83771.1 protein disulfide isomerase [Encephalitozoon romaleae SJ-2008]